MSTDPTEESIDTESESIVSYYRERFRVVSGIPETADQLRADLGFSRWYGSSASGTADVGHDPLHNVLDHVARNGCRSIIVERTYRDRDYLDEFSRYYSVTFQSHDPMCVRLHFFATQVEENGIASLEEHSDAYLGYSIVRPMRPPLVGRTVLRASSEADSFVTCEAPSRVSVGGAALQASGAPFMQQDHNVGSCAQAVLWMLALYMHQAYGFPRYYPGQVSDLATQYLAAPSGSEGLTRDQILNAIAAMGYRPRFKMCSSAVTGEIVDFIYAYVESGIPVVIASRDSRGIGHTVLAVGHTLRSEAEELTRLPTNIALGTKRIPYGSSADWVRSFIVNDDREGPYGQFDVTPEALNRVTCVFAATPPEVSLSSTQAQLKVSSFFAAANRFLPTGKEFTEEDLTGLVVRPQLIRSNRFKMKRSTEHVSKLILHFYRSRLLPKYLWLFEIMKREQRSESAGQIVGEILVDATASVTASTTPIISAHLNGRIAFRYEPTSPNETGHWAMMEVSDFAPYEPLPR